MTSVSTAALALSTPPTAPTTARFRSASCFPRDDDDVHSRGRALPRVRRATSLPWRRHISRRAMLQCRRHPRFFKIHGGDTRNRSRPPHRPRAARSRARHSPRRRRKTPSHLRARSRHSRPLHSRRHDRQQLLRRAFRHGRQDRRQHRGTRNPHLRRRAHESRRDIELRNSNSIRSKTVAAAPKSTPSCKPSPPLTAISSANASQIFRAASPATT